MKKSAQVIARCEKVVGGRYVAPAIAGSKLTIVVPVFDESVTLLTRLIDSLNTQQFVDFNEFRVLLVVNNDRPGSKNYSAIYAANQEILHHDWSKVAKFVVDTVDCSSRGLEIADCSVGAARDIGLHIAALQFAKIDTNGILIHVDADVRFDDTLFLKKALDLFSKEDVIGVAGGKNREVILSEYPLAEYPDRQALSHAFQLQATAGRCKYLLSFISGDTFLYRVFTGTNMLGRAYESVLAGGIPHINYLEDWQYGFRLWEYATDHRQRVIIDRSLRVVASFRISERTGSSFKGAMRDLLQGTIPIAKHPHTGDILELNEATYQMIRQEALLLPHGDSIVAYMDTYDITVR